MFLITNAIFYLAASLTAPPEGGRFTGDWELEDAAGAGAGTKMDRTVATLMCIISLQLQYSLLTSTISNERTTSVELGSLGSLNGEQDSDRQLCR